MGIEERAEENMEEGQARKLAEERGMPFIDLKGYVAQKRPQARVIPIEMIRQGVIPIEEGETTVFAVSGGTDWETIDTLLSYFYRETREESGPVTRVYIAAETEIRRLIKDYEAGSAGSRA